MENSRNTVPAGKVGTPEEVANAVSFLARRKQLTGVGVVRRWRLTGMFHFVEITNSPQKRLKSIVW